MEVSPEEYSDIDHIIDYECPLALAKYIDFTKINEEIIVIIPPPPGQRLVAERRKCAPFLFQALSSYAPRCVKWLLEHNANPNSEWSSWTALMYACYYHDNRCIASLLEYGAIVHIPQHAWAKISRCISNPHSDGCLLIYRMVARMLNMGATIKSDQDHVPPICRQVYDDIILAREAACRRACYTFLLDGRLPRDLVRWMLTQYVLPSKRESTWSPLNVKMPKGFEILD